MYEQLKEMLEQMVVIDISQTANYRALVILRDKFISLGWTKEFAESICSCVKFELPPNLNDWEIEDLVNPFSRIVDSLKKSLEKDNFNVEPFLQKFTVGTKITLKD